MSRSYRDLSYGSKDGRWEDRDPDWGTKARLARGFKNEKLKGAAYGLDDYLPEEDLYTKANRLSQATSHSQAASIAPEVVKQVDTMRKASK